MRYIPLKYRFFLDLPNIGEREVFPLHNPGNIQFAYAYWNEYTHDFKVSSSQNFIFVDDLTKENTDTEINRPYSFFRQYAETQVQSINLIVREFNGATYTTRLTGKLKIMDDSFDLFTDTQKKFVGKIETTSKHQELENLFDTDVNILETSSSFKKTATLQSTATDYENCIQVAGVIQHILTAIGSGITLSSDPFPYITDVSKLGIEEFLIADKTDIKRPNASSNATILNLSLLDFLQWLKNLFGLKYRLTTGNEMYFEHESETTNFEKELTDNQILNFTTRSYGYVDYPKSQLWEYEEANTNGFVKQLIEFDVNEGSQDKLKGSALNCDIEFIDNNNTAIGANPDAKDEVADSGACLIGADSSFDIYELGGVPNSKLQLDYLIENVFYYDLYFDNFTLNGVDTQIQSEKKRQKTEIVIKKYNNFDPNTIFTTTFGDLKIRAVNMSGDKLKLKCDY